MTQEPAIQVRPPLPVIPFLLTCVLIGLKISGHLAISWWLVFLPLYIGPAVGLLVLAVFLAIFIAFIAAGIVWVILESIIDVVRK